VRALFVALLLALATVVPVFADDGGDAFRVPAGGVEMGAPERPAP
jgi:hypothetical protein